ncbi:MAG: shikimate kinase [Clostridiales bacterium]|nr:shikimate kinase [Clostridiales bacterium]
MNKIILIGFMGVGKTTIGSELAKKLSYAFVDTDEKIMEIAGTDIPDIFNRHGEEYFRRLEYKAIMDIMNLHKLVVSTGGGAVMNRELFNTMLSKGTVIHLDASSALLYDRLKDSSNRPMLNHGNLKRRIDELYTQRRPIYMMAHHTVTTDGKSKEQIMNDIIKLIGRDDNK